MPGVVVGRARPQTQSKPRKPKASSAAFSQNAQQKQQLKKSKKRAVELEMPPPMHRRVHALINSQYPGDQRQSSSAYDERVCKRRRIDPLIGLPWECDNNDRLEKPGYGTLDALASPSNALTSTKDPIASMGAFSKLPAEVRENIFRGLLTHYCAIRVLHNWSLVYRRSRPNLDTAILRVCRIFYLQGIRILYGENTFVYLIRDPHLSKADTSKIINRVFGEEHIPINKHGHLIRNIRIVVEANRLSSFESRESVPRAIQKFLPGHGLQTSTRLRAIELQIPLATRGQAGLVNSRNKHEAAVLEFFRPGTATLAALKELNCQWIRIIAHDFSDRWYKSAIDRRPYFTQMDADSCGQDPWENDEMMLRKRRHDARRSKARLDSLWYWIQSLSDQPDRILATNDIFTEFDPEPQASGPCESLSGGSNSNSVTPTPTSGVSSPAHSTSHAHYFYGHIDEAFLEEYELNNDDLPTPDGDWETDFEDEEDEPEEERPRRRKSKATKRAKPKATKSAAAKKQKKQ